jgi:hypothetical protein
MVISMVIICVYQWWLKVIGDYRWLFSSSFFFVIILLLLKKCVWHMNILKIMLRGHRHGGPCLWSQLFRRYRSGRLRFNIQPQQKFLKPPFSTNKPSVVVCDPNSVGGISEHSPRLALGQQSGDPIWKITKKQTRAGLGLKWPMPA